MSSWRGWGVGGWGLGGLGFGGWGFGFGVSLLSPSYTRRPRPRERRVGGRERNLEEGEDFEEAAFGDDLMDRNTSEEHIPYLATLLAHLCVQGITVLQGIDDRRAKIKSRGVRLMMHHTHG